MTETGANSSLLKVTTLGWFSVKIGDTIITDSSKRMQKIWTLFCYILTNRGKKLEPESFIDVLWKNEECPYPVKTLQNLVYRLRNALSSSEGHQYILNVSACYTWNNNAPAVLDFDVFERIGEEADVLAESDPDAAIEKYRKAIEMYRGKYLPDYENEDWLLLARNRYRELYVRFVLSASALLKKQQRFQEIISLCTLASETECYEERFYIELIKAYDAIGRADKVLECYDKISSLLHKDLGQIPSVELKDEYLKAYRRNKKDQGPADIDSIREMVTEKGRIEKAFLCDVDTFRILYRLKVREVMRSGRSVFIALLTLVPRDDAVEDFGQSEGKLLSVVMSSLRKDDIVCQWNENQVVLLLHHLTYENGEQIMQRLINNYQELNGNSKILKTKIQPININYTSIKDRKQENQPAG